MIARLAAWLLSRPCRLFVALILTLSLYEYLFGLSAVWSIISLFPRHAYNKTPASNAGVDVQWGDVTTSLVRIAAAGIGLFVIRLVMPTDARTKLGEQWRTNRSFPGGFLSAAACYYTVVFVSEHTYNWLVSLLRLPQRDFPGPPMPSGHFPYEALASGLAAGWCEELAVLAIPMGVAIARGWGAPRIIALLVALRLAFHLYYGWSAGFVLLWIPAAYVLYKWVGSIWPFIAAHSAFDCIIYLENYRPSVSHLGVFVGAAATLWACAVLVQVWYSREKSSPDGGAPWPDGGAYTSLPDQ